MKTIMVKHYVFNCEDVECNGVSCDDCPLFNNSPFGKTGYGDSDCVFIAENNINDFISQFDDISLTIKPRKE
ncbi:MAG: hypothetical protein IKE95_00060 [Methanobrevibacter sp.]|nr:hypothetical protein [Methanobrevibacter sp.]